MKKLTLLVLLAVLATNALAYGGALGGFIFLPESKNNGNNYLFHQELDNIKEYKYSCANNEMAIWQPQKLEVFNTCSSDLVRNVNLNLNSAVKKGYFDIMLIGQTVPRYMSLNGVYQVIDVRMNGKGDASVTIRLPDSDYSIYKQKKKFGFGPFRQMAEWEEITPSINGNDYTFNVANEQVFAAVKNA